MPNMIDGKRLLTWLNGEYQRIDRDRNNLPKEVRPHITGALIELFYVIDHVERMVNKGGTNGKKD